MCGRSATTSSAEGKNQAVGLCARFDMEIYVGTSWASDRLYRGIDNFNIVGLVLCCSCRYVSGALALIRRSNCYRVPYRRPKTAVVDGGYAE